MRSSAYAACSPVAITVTAPATTGFSSHRAFFGNDDSNKFKSSSNSTIDYKTLLANSKASKMKKIFLPMSIFDCLVPFLLSVLIVGSIVVEAASSPNSRHFLANTGGCKAVGKCCRGKDSSCFTTGPRISTARRTADRKCYCDETCRLTRDCCADYKDYCTKLDCRVGHWGKWGKCSHECGVGVAERFRNITVHPSNGGAGCPALKQKRVCMGSKCIAQRSLLSRTRKETAKVLPAAFGTWRRHKLYDARQDIRRNLYANEMDNGQNGGHRKNGYCGRYRVTSVSNGCQIIPWVRTMMPVGGEVCAECQPEAMKTNLGQVCKGHGEIGKPTRFTTPIKNYCYGTWELLGEMTDSCSCSHNSTLIFV